LLPSTQLVIQRYVGTMDKSQVRGKEAGILRHTMPGQTGAYVVHCWSSAFGDMVETLQRVVEADDVVLVPGLALCSDLPSKVPQFDDPDGIVELRCMALTAMSKAERVVVIADQQLGFSRCPQCVREISEASRRSSLVTYLCPHLSLDMARFGNCAANMQLPMQWDEDGTTEADETQNEGTVHAGQDSRKGSKGSKATDDGKEGQGSDSNTDPVQELREFVQDRAVNFVYALQALAEEPQARSGRLLCLYEQQERLVTQNEVRRRHLKGECKLEEEVREHARYISNLQKNLEQERDSHKKTNKLIHQTRADTRKLEQESKSSVQEINQRAERIDSSMKITDLKLSKLKEVKSAMDVEKANYEVLATEERDRAAACVKRRQPDARRVADLQQKLEAVRVRRKEQQRQCRALEEQRVEVDRHCASIEAQAEELRRKVRSSRLPRSRRPAD